MSRYYPWTEIEDEALRVATEAGVSCADIVRLFMPHRSPEAIRVRRTKLRNDGALSATNTKTSIAASLSFHEAGWLRNVQKSSEKHVAALLRYGVRHGVDLAMGRPAFLAACKQHGINA